MERESKDVETEKRSIFGKNAFVYKGVYQTSGDLRNRNLFLTVLEAVKTLAGLVSSKASLLGLLMATFSLYPHVVFLLCVCIPGVPSCIQISSSYKDTSQ